MLAEISQEAGTPIDHSTELIDAAVSVMVNRYRLSSDDALDMLHISSSTGALSATDLASWLVYDSNGNYYPEPDVTDAAP